MLECEVASLVVGCRIWWWGREAVDLDAAVVARSRKVLVRRVECDAFDMALVLRESLELLESGA